MSEAIELEQWWADIADELGGQAAYLHVHGMDWRGRTDGNEVVARAVATIARLTAEIATFQAMMLDCEAERDALAADLAALRAKIEAASSALRSELTLHCGSENVLTDGMKYALAILAPPEGP